MTAEAIQNWVAECQYPGRRSFWTGSFAVPANTPIEDARKQAYAAAVEFMENITPDWLAPPKILQVRPGSMFLVFEDDEGEP